MLKAYWLPASLFYIAPSAVMIGSEWPVPFEGWAAFSLPALAVFGVGALLAPIVGPKVRRAKFYSFVMAYLCLIAAYCSVIVGLVQPENLKIGSVFGGALITLIVGSLPVFMGATYFVGYCKAIDNGS